MSAMYKVTFEKVADVNDEEVRAVEELSCPLDNSVEERFVNEDAFDEEHYQEALKALGEDTLSELKKLKEDGDTFVIM